MTVTPEIAARVFRRSGRKCENCGERKNLQLHHALFGRRAGDAQFDVEENLWCLCRSCHVYATGYKRRLQFWKQQVEYYGEAHMLQWWESINLKSSKERFW